MKYLMAMCMILFCGNSLVQASEIGYGKNLECIEANRVIAADFLNSAAKSAGGLRASEVTLDWNSDTEYSYSGVISKGTAFTEYHVTVKTDSNCFPLSLELK
jgi:hypothetical protein